MRFDLVTVYPAFSREILVEWHLSHATEPGVYLFHVERSETPEGPWTRLTAVPIVNLTFFIDRSLSLLSKENFVWYRVIATTPSGKEVISPAKDLFRNLERHQWFVAREITRKEILRFRKFVGVRASVLKLKHFGEVCSDCVDPVSGDVTNSSCEECFGTKFVGGYYPPIEAWIETSPLPNAKGLGGQGWVTEDFAGQVRMISYPLVTRDDIIVELESNRRFRVAQIDPIELRTVPLIQLVAIKMMGRDSVEYKIPAFVQGDSPCGGSADPNDKLAPFGPDVTTVQTDEESCPPWNRAVCKPAE